MEFSIAFQ
uniref:Uncharacterized protein n=1 Tax=Anguilla anguilla TaxID=7936 RepID=A0A0E9TIE1_ANGAN